MKRKIRKKEKELEKQRENEGGDLCFVSSYRELQMALKTI